MIEPLLIGFAAGLLLGWLFMRWRRTRKVSRRYLAVAEFWVYIPGTESPSQDSLMNRMIRDNPFGTSVIGPAEGILFSDVRLHSSLVLRSKNSNAFRPDLFSSSAQPDAEALRRIAHSESFLKLRYLSESPLSDARHVHFLTHMAYAAAELSGSQVIFDYVGEKLILVEDLGSALAANSDAARSDLQIQVTWSSDGVGGHAESRGLMKVGLPELATAPADADQRVLITAIVEEAVKTLWSRRSYDEALEVEAFGDRFRLEVQPVAKGPYIARIMRFGT